MDVPSLPETHFDGLVIGKAALSVPVAHMEIPAPMSVPAAVSFLRGSPDQEPESSDKRQSNEVECEYDPELIEIEVAEIEAYHRSTEAMKREERINPIKLNMHLGSWMRKLKTDHEDRAHWLRIARESKSALPDIEDACDLMLTETVIPVELIAGVLHQGSKLVLGGGSKSFKTWSLLDMAISVATGTDWWGFNTRQGRVLYVNFEIQKAFFAARLREVRAAKNVTLLPDQLHTHNLRGHAADADIVIPMIEDKMKANSYALVIVDPLYKLLGSKDENATRDMAAIMNRLESLAVHTGAAVVFGSHFAKGNASGKESMDRISGSGVFARDPDAILTMTAHESDGAFTVDLTLRNNKPQKPFVVRRVHPLMIRDEVLDPSKLKTKPGRKVVVEADELLDLLDDEPLSSADWQKKAEAAYGIKRTAFMDKTNKLRREKKIKLNPQDRYERMDSNNVPTVNFRKEQIPTTVG